MKKLLLLCVILLTPITILAQWTTQYVTFDTQSSNNYVGTQAASVAAIAPNRFVALATERNSADLFAPDANYLVGYWDADSGQGAVTSVPYGLNQFVFLDWESSLDKVTMKGAWQIANDDEYRIYVANNDKDHNILVFELTDAGVVGTDFRMETGTENIWGIEVDTAGYVYVVDFEGRDDKTNEVKVYAPIGTPGTNWDTAFSHTDQPVATIDLPQGEYHGITVSGDGTQLFVSEVSSYSVWKYVGDPETGYTRDETFEFTLSIEDSVRLPTGLTLPSGRPSVQGLAYDDASHTVFVVIDSLFWSGEIGGYAYGRIYLVDSREPVGKDTIDIAAFNYTQNGSFTDASDKGDSGGFTSVMDVDYLPSESAVYTQTFFGWAVEKWITDGVVSVEQAKKTIPSEFALKQNYPNPFNPSTTIEFDLNKTEHVTLEVYNVVGQKVATLVDETIARGSYKATFTVTNLTSGVFFYKLKAGAFQDVKKMVLTK